MKFTVKIGKIEDVKSDGRVEWNKEKKLGEIKIRYEDGQKIFVVGLGPKEELSVGNLQKVAAKLGKRVKEEGFENLALVCPETGLNPAMGFIEAIIQGLLLGSYEFKKYKTEKVVKVEKVGQVEKGLEITILVKNANELIKTKEAVVKAEIYSQAVFLARDLVNEPSSVTTPKYLANLAAKMAKDGGFTCKVYEEKEIEKMGMGLFLGVARGSDEPPRFIKLEYPIVSVGGRGNDKTIVLIGKGVTFDTGGLSLKTSESMETMKMDMAGAAALLAIFSVLAKLKPKLQVIGLIPCTENMPSGKAIKPGDILKSFSGKTVEVLNTDAEGRLILADALSYGQTLKPDVMIDLATLTGACMVALGEDIAGLFTKDEKLKNDLLKGADSAGEKIWPLPLEESYKELLKSEVADLKNVAGKKYGGAITAALFLREFVGRTVWAHLDIAGPAWQEKGTDLIPKGGSGFGVRTILEYLSNLSN